MDIPTLNEILTYIDAPCTVTQPIIESGQRMVYFAKNTSNGSKVVLKVCPLLPTAVARIKREIRILRELDSVYFPKVHFEFFVTEEVLGYFVDQFDPKTDSKKIEKLAKMQLKPFLVTVEECIDHVEWPDCREKLKEPKVWVDFLIHLFSGLKLLWDKKIVHRDLKPANILIRPDLTPVIIDLGIAKNMSDGATALTAPGAPSPCTPQFAAPEQLISSKTEITYKSDQFAVGVISFVILGKQFPFGSLDQVELDVLLRNIYENKLIDLRKLNPNLPDSLVKMVERLVSNFPYKRFRTVEEIIDSLKAIRETL